MSVSSFIYGNTVSENSFTNSEKRLEKSKSNLINGVNTMIISLRLFGKIIIIKRRIQLKTINIDLKQYLVFSKAINFKKEKSILGSTFLRISDRINQE